jgi:excisionase family DNA binding protein
MDFLTTKEAAELWGVTERRVQVLCAAGRIEGAQRLGGKVWIIPKGASRPIDGRTKEAKQSRMDKNNEGRH